MNEGWKCPGCYLIHAPFVKSCSCQQGHGVDVTRHTPGVTVGKGGSSTYWPTENEINAILKR